MPPHDEPGDPASVAIADRVRAFYERHPYPGATQSLASDRESLERERRADHGLLWPHLPFREDRSILVAGCGTIQAARHAMRWPKARVVGIDVSAESIARTAELKSAHELANLELRVLPVEKASELDEEFEQIVCTGVLHHLANPDAGLAALRTVLAPDGAMNLMVYAPYGRAGIYLLQEYGRRLGLGHTPEDIAEFSATLKRLPGNHPIAALLKSSPDFGYDAGFADALLHPQDRPYSVPEFFRFIGDAGLAFDRWLRQAPYLPHCGLPRSTPHFERMAALPPEEQHAAMELFRGTMLRHSAIVRKDAAHFDRARVRFAGDDWLDYRPIKLPGTICIEERLPPGAAGVLINRRHTDTDIYLPISTREKSVYGRIDGRRTVRGLLRGDMQREPARQFFEQLWRQDQIVFDISGPVAG